MRKIVFAGLFIILIVSVSCVKENEESENYGSSHNTGKNCLSCHSNFKLAGSVYNKSLSSAYPGATIKLTSQSNGAGTVLTMLTSDNTGNFHTGSSIGFGSGVYVSVTGTSGTTKYMTSAITNGACNSCHGPSTSKIWIE
jgi:hypothetical protein